MTTDPRIEALAELLEVDASEIEEDTFGSFAYGSWTYLVLTDDEADEKAADYCADTLWAFRPEWLANFMPEGVDAEVIEAVQTKYEDANPSLRAMIGDRWDEFVEDSIRADGRGHFLAGYDGNEDESGEFFIYRTN